MKERLRLAQIFDEQSEYIHLYRHKLGIVATLGWTFAEYTVDSRPDPKQIAVLSRNRSQILPEKEWFSMMSCCQFYLFISKLLKLLSGVSDLKSGVRRIKRNTEGISGVISGKRHFPISIQMVFLAFGLSIIFTFASTIPSYQHNVSDGLRDIGRDFGLISNTTNPNLAQAL